MERGICNICQRFFVKVEKNQMICNECYEKDKEEYGIVKDYLHKNRWATIMDLYLVTKVPIKTIKRYIEDGRIEIIEK